MALRKKGVSEETYKPCQHLLDYRAKHGARGFRVLQRCIKAGPLGRASLKKEGKEVPECTVCGKSHGRLYACLLCATIGCWMPPDALHARAHAQAKPGHDLAIDVDRAELFCCGCSDQVYDPDFDRAVICAQSASLRANGSDRKHHGSSKGQDRRDSSLNSAGFKPEDSERKRPEQRRKRRKAEYQPWVPTSREQLLLRRGSTPLGDDSCLPWGLRGLNNLGNTCFMNSVLQALLHTPPLRNYFLSDRHNRKACQGRGTHLCLGCDMDTIYSAAFSGDRAPYSPAQFLHSWWQHAANLAGYEQQDAHEFFISAVDGIHANAGNSSRLGRISRRYQSLVLGIFFSFGVCWLSGIAVDKLNSLFDGSAGDGDCDCIAHRVFSGLLRSDVTCTVCGFSSTTYDPCIDISLDLEPGAGSDKVYPDPYLSNGDGGRSSKGVGLGLGTSTLYGCLDRFTRPERLGSNEKFYCQNCQVRQESVKQMSLRKLPLVLCLHIKRFEHSSVRNMSRKVDRYVQFPVFLDMSPYLSSSIVRMRHGNRLLFVDGDDMDSPLSFTSPPEFELFAVVTHSGKLDSGHYIAFLRLAGLWYKCDDAWVTQVSEDVVRASQGYMLYYVQKTFSYKTSEHWPEKDGLASGDSNGNHKESGYSLANGF